MNNVIQFPRKINYRDPIMSPADVQDFETIFNDASLSGINRRLTLVSLMSPAEDFEADLEYLESMTHAVINFQESLNKQVEIAKFALLRLERFSDKFQA